MPLVMDSRTAKFECDLASVRLVCASCKRNKAAAFWDGTMLQILRLGKDPLKIVPTHGRTNDLCAHRLIRCKCLKTVTVSTPSASLLRSYFLPLDLQIQNVCVFTEATGFELPVRPVSKA
jgi:hypothetical protein